MSLEPQPSVDTLMSDETWPECSQPCAGWGHMTANLRPLGGMHRSNRQRPFYAPSRSEGRPPSGEVRSNRKVEGIDDLEVVSATLTHPWVRIKL